VDVAGGSATIRWRNTQMQSYFNTPVLVNGLLYGTTDPNDLVCLDPTSGDMHWRQSGFERGGVAAADGVIFAVSGSNGAVAMVEAVASGYHELGRFTPLGGQSWTAPIIADGALIVRNHTALACYELK
jgi:outer membrane protein assembly factor BamB